MEFDNNKSIFLQIADNIMDQVIQGRFPPGEKIPSVRELAAEVGVNPNTIMRTYTELQSLEILDNKRGIGYFVSPGAKESILQKKKGEFYAHVLPEFVRKANLLGITADDLIKYFDKPNDQKL